MGIDSTSISGRTRAEDPRLRGASARKDVQKNQGQIPDAHDTDRVQLSSLTYRISSRLEAATDRRAERLEALARQVSSGEFQPDTEKISKALIQEAVDSRKP